MKAGSTLLLQALRAAVQLPAGFDCTLSGQTDLAARVAAREEPLWRFLEGCSEEVFKWEIAKDPAMTRLAGQLAAAWPALASHGRPLQLYFLVREPFACISSFVAHLELQIPSLAREGGGEQTFSLENLPAPALFTRGKQLALDTERDGLRYSGYIDAVVQRWVLSVDHYLRCPHRFVLMRYEDFLADPVASMEWLVRRLGLGDRWSEGSAERVRQATGLRYQQSRSSGTLRGADPEGVFGPPLYARVHLAVAERSRLLGYGAALRPPSVAPVPPLIDVPPPPTELDCSL